MRARRLSLRIAVVVLVLSISGCAASRAGGSDSDESRASSESAELASLLLTRLVPTTAANFSGGFTVTSIFVDRIPELTEATRTIPLEPPFSYRITGVGGAGIHRLDLQLFDEQDRLLASDTATGQTAIVEFSPFATAGVKIAVQSGASRADRDGAETPYYFLVVARSGSIQSVAAGATPVDPVEEMVSTLDYVMAGAHGLMDRGLTVQHIELARVRNGESVSLAYPLTGGTAYSILGGGGAGTTDLDLAIHDSQGNLIQQDVGASNTAVLQIQPQTDQNYSVEARLEGIEERYPQDHEFWFTWILAARDR